MSRVAEKPKPSKLYVVKAFRRYGPSLATSVLTVPMPYMEAVEALKAFNNKYQFPGYHYLEEWRTE